MSRTDAHKPFEIAYRPDAIWNGPRQNVTRSEMPNRGETDVTPWHEANRHFGRPECVSETARQMNRRERHNARAAMMRGEWDELTTQHIARHGAVWECY